jgi:Trypsin-co-occurring domain 2
MAEKSQPEASVGLAELIVAVREELEKADAARLEPASDRGDGPGMAKDPLLALREVELEVHFEVTRSKAGEGGIDFKVVSVGGSGSSGSSKIQKLRVLYGPAFDYAVVGTGEEGEETSNYEFWRAPLGGHAFGPRGLIVPGVGLDEQAIAAAVAAGMRQASEDPEETSNG